MYIRETFTSYLYNFLHPYRIHDYLRNQIPLLESNDAPKRLTYTEAIAISWSFAVFKALIDLLLINIIFVAVSQLPSNTFADDGIMGFLSGIGQYTAIFSLAVDAILFPMSAFFIIGMWYGTMRFYASLLKRPDPEQVVADIITVSLSAHVFLLIPIFGELLRLLYSLFLLYVGVRRNMEVSRTFAIMVLLSPFLLLFALGSCLVLLMMILTL